MFVKVLKKYPFLILAFFSFLMISVWFSDGKVLAGAEEGFSIFNTKDILSINDYLSEIGAGLPNPSYVSRIPTSLFVSALLSQGLSMWLIQATVFLFLHLTAALSVYFLSRELFSDHKSRNLISFFAGFFYIANLFAMSQVWHRFIYQGMFAWAYLPLFLILWIRWLETSSIKFLIVFVLSSFLYGNTFTQPGFLFTLWVPGFLFFLVKIFQGLKDGKKVVPFLVRGLIGVSIWFTVNAWWLYPYLKIGPSTFSGISSWKDNLGSLLAVSSNLKQVLTLDHKLFLSREGVWGSLYREFPLVYLMWLPFLIMVYGVLTSRKLRFFSFIFLLLLIGLFISKGGSAPLGKEFYHFLLSHISFVGALRNPYEKYGSAWLLPYSLFFGLGISNILNRGLRFKIIGLLLFFISCFYLVRPLWTGEVLPGFYKAPLPGYFKEANSFLNSYSGDARALVLPVNLGGGGTTTWGYRGIEPSEYLFDRETIGKPLKLKHYDQKYTEFSRSLAENRNYEEYLEDLNVGFLILRNDLDFNAIGASSSAEVNKVISGNPKMKRVAEFGELTIYEFLPRVRSNGLFTVETPGSNRAPSISYSKRSPRFYNVKVKDSRGQFSLVFKSNYSDLWEARLNGKVLSHLLVKGYANGWEIDKKGDFEIDIRFKVWPWE